MPGFEQGQHKDDFYDSHPLAQIKQDLVVHQ
jgi:hypothetical protein